LGLEFLRLLEDFGGVRFGQDVAIGAALGQAEFIG
jgi:hypothetical protein